MKEEKPKPGEETGFMRSQEVFFRFSYVAPASTTHLGFAPKSSAPCMLYA